MRTTILSLTALCFIATASAHPGKTDKNGGHKDSKTGEYHVHKKPEPPKKKK